MQYSSAAFEKAYTYQGEDLGATWSRERTAFKVWAPTADSVEVRLYASGDPEKQDLLESLPMEKGKQGVWSVQKDGDLNGIYYTYRGQVAGKTVEVCDPYARTTGVNGHRAMVLDLKSTDPEGWETDEDPNGNQTIAQAVICELHLRDLSMDPAGGFRHKGKYLALTETGTHTPGGQPTGLDHFCNLGITHLQLLPVYDYGSVDERREDQFNWGYDPVNFNVPEGSYSTDPYHGEVRVREFKAMVKAIHDRGISVVMDVVYNHVYHRDRFCINQLVPGYFSRIDESGRYSDGSGCGNDTASERSMVRKYIVDSVNYWADQYHIDGFRFDLAGLLDVQTIREVMETVRKRHPNVLFYGEGWTMGTALTRENVQLATQENAKLLPGFAFFNDTIRDGLRGSVFSAEASGYASGNGDLAADVADCYMGAARWCPRPEQSINYISCHDNLTLFDKLTVSSPWAYREQIIARNKLAAAMVLTARGVPFFQAGEEFLRIKPGMHGPVDNSYASPDSVNSIKWGLLDQPEYATVRDYYRGLIALRKKYPETGKIWLLRGLPFPVLGFSVEEKLWAIFNPTHDYLEIPLPKGEWELLVNDSKSGTTALDVFQDRAGIAPISATILRRK